MSCAPRIAACFDTEDRIEGVADFDGGHIHDSYLVTCGQGHPAIRYLLQRINDAVFRNPVQVMENITRVTRHVAASLKAGGADQVGRLVLTVVPTRTGNAFYHAPGDGYWRMYRFIEGTQTHQAAATPRQAHQAARAIGDLQNMLNSLPEPALHETIPDFHNTPLRYEQLERAVREDRHRRLARAGQEVEFAAEHKTFAGLLVELQQKGELPVRTVHNDAKISNVLFDADTDRAICVVDLDTIMPGLSLNDFGDMVRTMITTAREDEADLSRVELNLPLFEGLAGGYVQATAPFLTPCERAFLVASGQIITLEQGVRFLSDYLSGDSYYKTSRPEHNLDRCRNQFQLYRSLRAHESEMCRFVESL